MRFHLIAIAVAAALALAPGAADALAAQTGAAKKPAAGKTAAAKKPAVKKTLVASKSAPAKRKGKAPAKNAKNAKAEQPAPPPADEPLTEAQLTTAKEVYTGTIACELGASVTVTADDKNPGFFSVAIGKQRYYMHPVQSRTGVIRMEDPHAGAMWLQLGSKSMLMNQKLGQRMADECATQAQRDHAAELRAHPHSLFDEPKH